MISSPAGSLILHPAIPSLYIEGTRDAIVYLPPGYDEDALLRYPVLYLQDGQNLFDPATAFANQDWGLGRILDSLILEGAIDPLLVVGIYNAGEKRIQEYSQIRNRQGIGGGARRYGKFVTEDLKPLIDTEYRTKTGSGDTGIGGSSLGGLVSFYLGLHYPAVFGKMLVMSPSIWWANRAILRETRRLRLKSHQKIWLDVGTAEGSNPQIVVEDARDLRDVLLERGWELGQKLRFVEDEGAGHDERAWGCRMHDALTFLFCRRGQEQSIEIDSQPELHY